MPIRAELRHHYRTPEWRAAREAVKQRAGDRCERCNAKNGSIGFRNQGKLHLIELTEKDAAAVRLQGPPWLNVIRIQCGCAHRNGIAGDDRLENLAWWCRGCHLLADREQHRRTRQERKDRARPLLEAQLSAVSHQLSAKTGGVA